MRTYDDDVLSPKREKTRHSAYSEWVPPAGAILGQIRVRACDSEIPVSGCGVQQRFNWDDAYSCLVISHTQPLRIDSENVGILVLLLLISVEIPNIPIQWDF